MSKLQELLQKLDEVYELYQHSTDDGGKKLFVSISLISPSLEDYNAIDSKEQEHQVEDRENINVIKVKWIETDNKRISLSVHHPGNR